MSSFVVLWIIFVVISSVVASNKGRGGFGWFIIGLLLGPAGVVLALVVSKNSEVIESEAIRSGEQKKCKYCAELIKSEAVLCKHCGKEQDEKVSDIVAAQHGSSEHQVFQDAIYKEDIELMKKMLAAGFNVAACDLPFQHLDYAKFHNKTKAVELLEKLEMKQ